MTDRVYANGVVRSIAYDEQFSAPSSIQAWYVNSEGATKYLQDDQFTRDSFGRVIQIADNSNSVEGAVQESQCFVYDGHNRLSQAWTDASAGYGNPCAAFPTLPTTQVELDASAWMHAAAPYATTWAYSKSGKIDSITNLIADAAPFEQTQEMSYGHAGDDLVIAGDLEHAVTKSVTKDDGVESGTAKFKYDDAGRQTRRTITDEVTGKVTTEVLTWDVASNLVSSVVDDGSHYDYWTYLYDASGQRWAKIEHPTDVTLPTQATVYLGDTEITDTDTFADGAHDVTAVRYFTFGGSTVAVEQATEVAAGDPVDDVPFFYLFGDYQGSAQLMMSNETDPSTATIQRNAYTPYGSQRALNTDLTDDSPDVTFDASLSIERGWLSQVADEATTNLGTGLTYLNARYYDPLTSRFLSPDPLLDVMDPKTLDPYRYADNNPVFYSDATGLSAESVCGLYGCLGGKPGERPSKAARDEWTKKRDQSAPPLVETHDHVDLGPDDVVISFFIEGAQAGPDKPIFLMGDVNSTGDDRGFTNDFGELRDHSRLFIWYDASESTVEIRVNSTCEWPEKEVCHSSGPNNVTLGFNYDGESEVIQSEFDANLDSPAPAPCLIGGCGTPRLNVTFDGTNPALNWGQRFLGPELTQEISIYAVDDGSWRLQIYGTGFPSAEGYVYRADGSIDTIFQSDASRDSKHAGDGLMHDSRWIETEY